MGFEGQAMPLLHLGPLQLEVFRRPSASLMIPPVGEQDTADIQKQRSDWHSQVPYLRGERPANSTGAGQLCPC